MVLVTSGWAPSSVYPTVKRFYISGPFMVMPHKHKPAAPIRERYRLVMNYRALNRTLTPVDCKSNNPNGTIAIVPTPRIEDMWAALKDRFFFSSLDLRSCYHHILIKDEDQHKTAFVREIPVHQSQLQNSNEFRLSERCNE